MPRIKKKLKRRDRKAQRLKQVIYSHYTFQYLLEPRHPITVKVLGCGGTGSQMLSQLARIHASLLHLGHPGIIVQAWDPDKVTEANLGRQLFAPMDLGQYKAKILIQRINRFYGFNWQAYPLPWDKEIAEQNSLANIMITAVDNVATRKLVASIPQLNLRRRMEPFNTPLYWLDLGNMRTTGQTVLGTFGQLTQPKGTRHTVGKLPTILDMFPDLEKREDKDLTPSCSLAEALGKQDLFINSTLAQYGADLIWKLFRELRIQYHGVYVNLETLQTNPIRVKP